MSGESECASKLQVASWICPCGTVYEVVSSGPYGRIDFDHYTNQIHCYGNDRVTLVKTVDVESTPGTTRLSFP